MSLDIKRLKMAGCSSGAYKKIFTLPPADYPRKVRELQNLISANIRDGITGNLREHRAYYAVDLAYETPFNQTTPTLVRHIMDQHLDFQGTQAALKAWGLSEEELFLKVNMGGDKIGYVPNPPVFFNVLVPIVKAYVTAIEGQIFNERNTQPLLPYKPLKQTDRNTVLCEVQTDIAETMATWLGYPAVMRQAIQQQLKYGIMLAFPREEWYCDTQERIGDDGKPERYTVKEGIRYHLPHPARMFYDLEYPLTSFNTDSGCAFAGFWHAISYGSILDNRDYWNRRNIFSGTNWFQSPLAGNYFSEVFPCRMDFKHSDFGPMSREDRAAYYNSSADREKMVFVTEYFHRIIPRDWGLGEYSYPVWHRFTVAGDDTIIWAEPCAYNPVWFMGYDYDEQSARTSSLGLEILPWQDHLGMILTQMLLSAKQNQLNVMFYDTNVIDDGDIKKWQNLGESRYRSISFIPFDSIKQQAARLSMKDALIPAPLSKVSIQELLQMIPAVLGIMERVLGISSQTAGSQGTHQQSKAEVTQTAGSSQNRIALISSHTDEGINAWMMQLHDGVQAYHDGAITAQVSADIPDLDDHLKELGFDRKGESADMVTVTGHKSKIRLEGFARVYRGPQVDRDKESAQVIFSTVGTVAGQPDLFKQVGARTLLKLIEFAAILGGAGRDFKLKLDPNPKDDKEVPEQVLEAIKQAQAATLQQVEEKIAKPIAQEMAGDKQQIGQIEQVLKQLEGIYKIASAQQDKNTIKAGESRAKLALKEQEQAAAERRRDESLAREQARKDQELVSQLQRDNAELAQKLEAMRTELAAKIEAERVRSEAAALAAATTASGRE